MRDNNLLAYSSRILNLSYSEKIKASILTKELNMIFKQIKKNIKNLNKIKFIKDKFSRYGIKIEYLEIRNKFNLSKKFNKNNFKLFVAFYINKVRLIDNF